MKCPFCFFEDTIVKDSRIASDGAVVRRRRNCLRCDARFSTYEEAKLKEIYIVKRSGVKKPFDRSKIYNSIATAMRKRNIGENKIEEIVNNICAKLEGGANTEILTHKIGDLILEELAQIDEVAYIRFASVYKDFATAYDFSKFINLIKRKKKNE